MTATPDLLLFEPIYQERVWGGRILESELGRSLPPGAVIGESWEIADRAEAQSRVRGGALAGTTLRDLIARDGGGIMGPGWPAEAPFPILVKWLDCRESVSLQVHPTRAAAAELQGEPKTENWFVAHAAPGARLLVGLKPGITRAEFEQAIARGAAADCVREVPVRAGDSILIQSGHVHAVCAGSLILEIQQNSDTTYRIYDWGRKGLDGKPRRLHIAESLRSIRWNELPPEPVRKAPASGMMAECAEFTIRRAALGRNETLRVAAGEQPRLVSVVEGSLEMDGRILPKGANALLPFGGEFAFTSPGSAILLLTENFAPPAEIGPEPRPPNHLNKPNEHTR